MKIYQCFLVLTLLCLSVGAHGETKKHTVKHYAYWLQSLCQAKTGDADFAVRTSMCVGFISGLASPIDGKSTNMPDGTFKVSVGPMDMDAFIADYLLWLDTHEKDKNEEATEIVLRVLLATGNARLTRPE